MVQACKASEQTGLVTVQTCNVNEQTCTEAVQVCKMSNFDTSRPKMEHPGFFEAKRLQHQISRIFDDRPAGKMRNCFSRRPLEKRA